MSDQSAGQVILNPVQAAPRERDHFWEIQHVVVYLLGWQGGNWQTRSIGEYMDLVRTLSRATMYSCH